MGMRVNKSVKEFFLLASISFIGTRICILSLSHSGWAETPMDVHDLAKFERFKLGEVPFKPFDPRYPKNVVVLTYQRCGSSFFGQLFNTNPDVFYMFEPLDSVYSAMYGTRPGWNVPSDITSHPDGTERIAPEHETEAVAVFLKHLLACNVDALPTETLIHKYLFQFVGDHTGLKNYIQCLRGSNIKQTNCSRHTSTYCGKRFGEFPQARMEECNQQLRGPSQENSQFFKINNTNFFDYKKCMQRVRAVVMKRCIGLFQKACDKTVLRSAKTVRGTMTSMGHMLNSVPNFRVIHLVRDPRAVVLSRKEFDNSAQGRYSRGDMVKEALLYCRTVVRDVHTRRKLELKYPGQIITVVYDHLVTEPLSYTKYIYAFLDTTQPAWMVQWLLDHTTRLKNSSAIARKWQNKLSFKKANEITQQCLSFFDEIDYPWVGV